MKKQNNSRESVVGSAQMQIAQTQAKQGYSDTDRTYSELDIVAALLDESFLEKYVYTNQEICNTVICRYLLRLRDRKGLATLGGSVGECALPAVKKPKTLSEAKLLTDIFINQ